ncbi:phage tail assembly chaperone [Herbaspirillum sp. ST 5-3]|uniref:phage tail assembly chaperone n=1 Tax=Oxalobacteraceae TaxID=75682 RepID=UPI0010A384A6|nr:phage tail assembly chaperone [Herbaspirillum sp. ST 5-3]
MFKIAVNPTYTAEVKVDVPTDNGKTVQRVFEAKFKRPTQTELDSIYKRIKDSELSDAGLIDEVMVGWSAVADEEGTALEFNPANLAALLEIHPTRPTIVQTFFSTVHGAKRKN